MALSTVAVLFVLRSFSLILTWILSSLLKRILKGLHDWMFFIGGGGNNITLKNLIFD